MPDADTFSGLAGMKLALGGVRACASAIFRPFPTWQLVCARFHRYFGFAYAWDRTNVSLLSAEDRYFGGIPPEALVEAGRRRERVARSVEAIIRR